MKASGQQTSYRELPGQDPSWPKSVEGQPLRQPGEPTPDQFGNTPVQRVLRLWLALRPPFFVASIMPVLVGTAWGAKLAGEVDILPAALALLCLVSGHGAANLLNDVHDDMSGNDRVNTGRIYPFSGGSRFIQNGIMGRREMTVLASALLVLTVPFGFWLLLLKGPGMIAFGLVLLLLLALHELPPLNLNYRGFAETIVALSFGVVPVAMASWLQAATVNWQVVLVSIPISMWIANVLLINEIPDRDADRATGKTTLVVLFGVKAAQRIYVAVNAVAFAACIAMVGLGFLNVWGLIGVAGLFGLSLAAARQIDGGDRKRLTKGIKTTLAIHAAGGFWLTGWIVLS